MPKDGEAVLRPRTAPQEALSAVGAEALRGRVALRAEPANDYLDALVEQLAERAGGPVDAWIERIRAEVHEAAGYDDLLGRLSVLLTDLPLDDLADVLAAGFGTAQRAGIADAQGGSDA